MNPLLIRILLAPLAKIWDFAKHCALKLHINPPLIDLRHHLSLRVWKVILRRLRKILFPPPLCVVGSTRVLAGMGRDPEEDVGRVVGGRRVGQGLAG